MDLSGWIEVVRLGAVTAGFVVVFYRLTEWIKVRACDARSEARERQGKTIGKVDLPALAAMERRFQTRAASMERAAENAASVGIKCWGEVAGVKIELDTLRKLLAELIREASTSEGAIIPSDERKTLERVVDAARVAGVYEPTSDDGSTGDAASSGVSVTAVSDAYEPNDHERSTDVGMRHTMPSPSSIPVPS